MPLLVLWDIDGTLLSSHGAGTRAMDAAFEECFGVRGAFDGVSMAGATDAWIFRQAHEKHALPQPLGVALFRFASAYHRLLPGILARGRVTLKPGFPDVLETLSRWTGLAQGLLTGNFEDGARAKLGAAGIDRFFSTGAYGSDHEDRNELLSHALRRFRERGDRFRPDQTVVVGDTPKDIACARAGGAKAVAVATGGHRLEDLESHGPDLACPSLADPSPLFRFLDELDSR
jgi:phosphoglycolate phosphatase-like HAD superfamily hydrolase